MTVMKIWINRFIINLNTVMIDESWDVKLISWRVLGMYVVLFEFVFWRWFWECV